MPGPGLYVPDGKGGLKRKPGSVIRDWQGNVTAVETVTGWKDPATGPSGPNIGGAPSYADPSQDRRSPAPRPISQRSTLKAMRARRKAERKGAGSYTPPSSVKQTIKATGTAKTEPTVSFDPGEFMSRVLKGPFGVEAKEREPAEGKAPIPRKLQINAQADRREQEALDKVVPKFRPKKKPLRLPHVDTGAPKPKLTQQDFRGRREARLSLAQISRTQWNELSKSSDNLTTGMRNPWSNVPSSLELAKRARQKDEQVSTALKRLKQHVNPDTNTVRPKSTMKDAKTALERFNARVEESDKLRAKTQKAQAQELRTLRNLSRSGGEITPAAAQQERDTDWQDLLEEGIGLDLTPADIALNFTVGGRLAKLGRNVGRGIRGVKDTTRGYKALDDELPTAFAAVQAARTTKTGRRVKRIRDIARSPKVRRGRLAAETAALAGAVGSGVAVPFVQGTAQGFADDPGKTTNTTIRNLISAVTSPFTAGGNLALSLRRSANELTGDGEGWDYALAPAKRTGEEFWDEAKQMYETYASKDADVIAKATTEDYGLINLGAAWFATRPLTRGTRAATSFVAGKTPSYGIPRSWYGGREGERRPTFGELREQRKKTRRYTNFAGRQVARVAAAVDQETYDFRRARARMNVAPGARATIGDREGSRTRVREKFDELNATEQAAWNAENATRNAVFRGPDEAGLEPSGEFIPLDPADVAVWMGRKGIDNLQDAIAVSRTIPNDAPEQRYIRALRQVPELLDETTKAGKSFAAMREAVVKAGQDSPLVKRDVLGVEEAVTGDQLATAQLRAEGKEGPEVRTRRPEEVGEAEDARQKQAVRDAEAKIEAKKKELRNLKRQRWALEVEGKSLAREERGRKDTAEEAVPSIRRLAEEALEAELDVLELERKTAAVRSEKGQLYGRLRGLQAEERAGAEVVGRYAERERREADRARTPEGKKARRKAEVAAELEAERRRNLNRPREDGLPAIPGRPDEPLDPEPTQKTGPREPNEPAFEQPGLFDEIPERTEITPEPEPQPPTAAEMLDRQIVALEKILEIKREQDIELVAARADTETIRAHRREIMDDEKKLRKAQEERRQLDDPYPHSLTEEQMGRYLEEGEYEGQSAYDAANAQNAWAQARPEDIFGRKSDDSNTLDLLPKFQRNEPITIYRAVDPELEDTGIKPGAYVTESREYAELHGEGPMNGRYKIVSEEVLPSELIFEGSPHEFLYGGRAFEPDASGRAKDSDYNQRPTDFDQDADPKTLTGSELNAIISADRTNMSKEALKAQSARDRLARAEIDRRHKDESDEMERTAKWEKDGDTWVDTTRPDDPYTIEKRTVEYGQRKGKPEYVILENGKYESATASLARSKKWIAGARARRQGDVRWDAGRDRYPAPENRDAENAAAAAAGEAKPATPKRSAEELYAEVGDEWPTGGEYGKPDVAREDLVGMADGSRAIVFRDRVGRAIGYVNFWERDDHIQVETVVVHPAARNWRMGSDLLHALQNEFPGKELRSAEQTELGRKLLNAQAAAKVAYDEDADVLDPISDAQARREIESLGINPPEKVDWKPGDRFRIPRKNKGTAAAVVTGVEEDPGYGIRVDVESEGDVMRHYTPKDISRMDSIARRRDAEAGRTIDSTRREISPLVARYAEHSGEEWLKAELTDEASAFLARGLEILGEELYRNGMDAAVKKAKKAGFDIPRKVRGEAVPHNRIINIGRKNPDPDQGAKKVAPDTSEEKTAPARGTKDPDQPELPPQPASEPTTPAKLEEKKKLGVPETPAERKLVAKWQRQMRDPGELSTTRRLGEEALEEVVVRQKRRREEIRAIRQRLRELGEEFDPQQAKARRRATRAALRGAEAVAATKLRPPGRKSQQRLEELRGRYRAINEEIENAEAELVRQIEETERERARVFDRLTQEEVKAIAADVEAQGVAYMGENPDLMPKNIADEAIRSIDKALEESADAADAARAELNSGEPLTNRRIQELYYILDRHEDTATVLLARKQAIRVRQVDLIDPSKMHAALSAAKAAKRDRRLAPVIAQAESVFEQRIDRYKEHLGVQDAAFVSHNLVEDKVQESLRPRSGSQVLGSRTRYYRTGELARTGQVNSTAKAFVQSVKDSHRYEANWNMSEFVRAIASFSHDFGRGLQRTFTDAQAAHLGARGILDISRYYKVDQRLMTDPDRFGGLLGVGRKSDAEFQSLLDRAEGELDRELMEAERNAAERAGEGFDEDAFARKLAAEGGGTKYYYIEKPVAKRMMRQENQLAPWQETFTTLNTIVSRSVLATSLSWLFAQPIAEFLVLLVDHPSVLVKGFDLARRRAQIIADDPEAARRLSMVAGNVVGTDPATKALLEDQRSVRDGIRELKQSVAGQALREAASLRVLGNLDRKKGAFIRELGVLAELDRELSNFRRQAKAIMGTYDEIEKVADRMIGMTDKQKLAFLDSEQGMAAMEKITRNIDASLGNWTDLTPGEKGLSSIVFFYPFVRFSLQWTFQNLPKRHPYRWSLAMILGTMNAEIMEQYIGENPAFMSQWATAPVWGNPEPGSAPTAFIPLNRFNPGGNAAVEFLGGKGANPLDALKVVTPAALIPIRAITGRDAYGNPVEGTGFGARDFTWGDFLRTFVDETTNLAFPLREGKRYLNLNYDKGKGIYGVTTAEGREFRVGDDPDNLRGFLSRALGWPSWVVKGLPPAELTIAKAKYDEAWKRYGEFSTIVNTGVTDRAARARDRMDDLKSRRDKLREDDVGIARPGQGLSDVMKKIRSLEKTPAYKEFVKQQGEIDEAEELALQAARDIASFHKLADLTVPKAQRNLIQEADKKPEIEFIPGTNVPKQTATNMPNEDFRQGFTTEAPRSEQRRKYGGPVGATAPLTADRSKKKTIPNKPPVRMTSGTPTKTRQQFSRSLEARHRQITKEQGGVKGLRLRKQKNGAPYPITHPMADPRTKINKGGAVAKYRGVPVLGKQSLAQIRKAEKLGTLSSEDGQIVTPMVRRTLNAVEKQSGKIQKLRERKQELARKIGGVPEAVPANLRGDVRKWGKYLERVLKEDGKSEVLRGFTGPEYIAHMLNMESGYNHDVTSPVGAYGLAQFMPGTRATFVSEYGVDPWNEDEAIQGMAYHLDGRHGHAAGVEGYNPYYENEGGSFDDYFAADLGETVVTNPKAAKKLKGVNTELERQGKVLDERVKAAKELGLPVRVIDETLPAPDKRGGPRPFKGKFMGARRAVSIVLGQPVWGDHMPTETQAGGPDEAIGGHSMAGQHAMDNAYAQDIGSAGGRPEEGEQGLGYDQPTIDKIVAGLQKMGSSIPDNFKIGQDWEGEVLPNGYQPLLLSSPESDHGDHIHFGMTYVGDGADGAGVSGGYGGAGGTTGGTTGGGGGGGGDFGGVVGAPYQQGGGGGNTGLGLEGWRERFGSSIPAWGEGERTVDEDLSAASVVASIGNLGQGAGGTRIGQKPPARGDVDLLANLPQIGQIARRKKLRR